MGTVDREENGGDESRKELESGRSRKKRQVEPESEPTD